MSRSKRAVGATAGAAAALATMTTAPAIMPTAAELHPAVPPEHIAQQHPAAVQPARHARQPARHARYVSVKRGDTLWSLAQRLFGRHSAWPRFYAANEKVIGPDPNLIRTGERLRVALAVRGSFGGAAPVAVPARSSAASTPPRSSAVVASSQSSLSGTLTCGGLEQLWELAGGSPGLAVIMASIGMAESGGQEFATDHDSNGTTDEGYFQINTSNGDATYDPLGNARAAVAIEATQGLGAWVTYTSGAYAGRC